MEIELGWLEVEQSSQRILLGHDDKVIELACNLFLRFFLISFVSYVIRLQ